jgi:hypothetical protein
LATAPKPKASGVKPFLRNNGLSITLLSLFLIFWGAQAITGFLEHNHDEAIHSRPPVEFGAYLRGEHFWEATFENWESEFLQMAAYVVLTVFLYQRGSAESKDPDQDRDTPAKGKHSWIYAHSLSLALGGLFLLSWLGHATAGWKHYNSEQFDHGLAAVTLAQFLTAPRFWFESFQNWQSEFLAVAAVVLLSIWLREKGSPESKGLSAPNSQTGK